MKTKTTYNSTHKVIETLHSHSSHISAPREQQPVQRLTDESKAVIKEIIKLTRLPRHKSLTQSNANTKYVHKVEIPIQRFETLIDDCANNSIYVDSYKSGINLSWITNLSTYDKMSISVTKKHHHCVICSVVYLQGSVKIA